MKHLQNNKGFSLVEMAIALVVMAIMAGVIYIASAPMRTDSKLRSSTEQLQQIETATVQFETKYNGYPTSLTIAKFLDYLPVAPDTSYWNYTCDTTSARVNFVASDDAVADNIGTEWQKTLGTTGVTVAHKTGTTPPNITGILKLGANCVNP